MAGRAPMSAFDYTVFITLITIALSFIIYKKYFISNISSTALDPTTYKKFKLIKRTDVNHNVAIFRFSLESSTQRLGLPVGQHMFLRFYDDSGKPVSRAYTPISSDDDIGYFDLMIKLYPTGKMSQYLQSRTIGDLVDVRGPSGALKYLGDGLFEIHRKSGSVRRHVTHCGMIAGGSGITPMLQIIREVTKNKTSDTLHKSLIFGNVSTNDILLRDELDAVQKLNDDRFKLHYVVDKQPDTEWHYSVGYITPEIIDKYLPKPGDDTLILLCGPKIMCDIMTKHLKESLNFTDDMIFSY